MLVFPNQKLSAVELERFSEQCFGTIQRHPLFPSIDGTKGTVEIRNHGKKFSTNEHWHTDVSFLERPPVATVLYALQVPEVGGDTQFSNQYMAYDALSPGLRDLLEGVRAVHTNTSIASRLGKESSTAVLHPLVQVHPETRQRCLFLCRSFVERLEGLTFQESKPLLEMLFERQVLPDFTFRHKWSQGDVVVWDNRSVLHYAIHDHQNAERVLLRCTTEGSESSLSPYIGDSIIGREAHREKRPRSVIHGSAMPRDLVGYTLERGVLARL
eukprot:g2413.t1